MWRTAFLPRLWGVSMSKSIGMIETNGMVSATKAADAALKSANVRLVGYDNAGDGRITVIVEGNISAVKAAIAAAKLMVPGVTGSVKQ